MKAVIAGAGVAGLGIGWRLAQAGVATTILERDEPGRGASFAAAGMIAATAEAADAPPAEAALAERARALWPGFAAELEAAAGLAIDYRRNGALMLGPRPATLPPGCAWLTEAALTARAPMLAAAGGALWAPREAQVDNRALARALAEAFRRAGGRLLTGQTVTGIEAGAAITAHGRHAADAVIVAAGPWSGALGLPVRPVKGQMIALAPPSKMEGSGAVLPGPVIWGNGVYLVPRADRLLVGATMEEAGFDMSLAGAVRDDLRARAEALIPGLKGWTLAEHWAGLRPASPDGLPLLGRLDSSHEKGGVFAAAGQYRNGILFAPAIADHLRDLVLGRAAVIPEFDPRRFADAAAVCRDGSSGSP
jgi:glycine oxidase